jgi:hypothetical protein
MKPQSINLESLLQAANLAYENGELEIHQPATVLGYARGDGLAEFIHNELTEVCEGEPERAHQNRAVSSIEIAIAQLTKVRDALESIGKDSQYQLASDYILHGFSQCPNKACGGVDIEGGFVDIEGNYAKQDVSCADCGTVWEDTYTLTSYSVLEKGI